MIRPRTPGMYTFTCDKPTVVSVPGDWVVGIVFRSTTGLKPRWCFYGVHGNDKWASGFSMPLTSFIGRGTFERVKVNRKAKSKK